MDFKKLTITAVHTVSKIILSTQKFLEACLSICFLAFGLILIQMRKLKKEKKRKKKDSMTYTAVFYMQISLLIFFFNILPSQNMYVFHLSVTLFFFSIAFCFRLMTILH